MRRADIPREKVGYGIDNLSELTQGIAAYRIEKIIPNIKYNLRISAKVLKNLEISIK